MNIEIVKQDKNEMEFRTDNLTLAEILRVYLNEQKVELAVWRREHPSKPILFKIISKDESVGKVISKAITAIKKDTSKLTGLLKK
ncbi:hypothetical protein J4461_01240 [Candidatus Pacearchaeota archaeon]|nr:hypothetical protein [Candidatus Pacearchaeota archaeon]